MMNKTRLQYSVLDSMWGLNKDTNEVVGLRILYFDVQMYRPFVLEMLKGTIEDKRMHYAIIVERGADAHTIYEHFQSWKDMYFENVIELDPKDHPFIAKFIREKELSNTYAPGSDWRYRYGLPPIIFQSSFMRYFSTNPLSSTIGWIILAAGSILGIWIAL